MREIKFRAWDIKDKIMCQIYELQFSEGEWWASGIPHIDMPEMKVKRVLRVSENPIMQYTGLHDKNGVDAYHKDRVKLYLIDYHGNADVFTGVIEWDEEDLCWYILNDSDVYPCVKFRFVDYFEIIGNTFETANPELAGG